MFLEFFLYKLIIFHSKFALFKMQNKFKDVFINK